MFHFTSKHELIGVIRDGEDVWWGLLALFAPVGHHHLLVVDWEPLVRVYSDTEQPWICLKNIEIVTDVSVNNMFQTFFFKKKKTCGRFYIV